MNNRTHEFIRYADLARESHLWPVAGGALDQTRAFLAAESLIRSDRARWRAEKGGGHG